MSLLAYNARCRLAESKRRAENARFYVENSTGGTRVEWQKTLDAQLEEVARYQRQLDRIEAGDRSLGL